VYLEIYRRFADLLAWNTSTLNQNFSTYLLITAFTAESGHSQGILIKTQISMMKSE
jgi:hypothetical protein